MGNKIVIRASWSVITGTKVAMSSVYATTSRTEGTERKATLKPRSFAPMMSARGKRLDQYYEALYGLDTYVPTCGRLVRESGNMHW